LPDTGLVDEELRLEVALFAAARRLAKAGGEAPKGLDRGGYWVLAKLAHLAPIRLSDLSIALELDPSTVSRHIKALWHAGLVGRESDPGDRRAALPTPAGRRSRNPARSGCRRWLTPWRAGRRPTAPCWCSCSSGSWPRASPPTRR
jgi:DNA-binding MarR family transcriptional regulator